MNRADVLAKNIAELKYDDIPEDVVYKAKLLIIDQLGCQIGFSGLPWSQAAHRYALRRKSAGESTVVVYGDKMNAEDAAFCNSVFGHGFEMDDTDMTTTSHPGVVMTPVVLALGEERHIDGKEALTAFVAGYEAMQRVARAGNSMYARFWHGTAVPGGFGSAAAAGHILGLDAEHMKHAFGVVSTEVGGNCEYTSSGGTVKRTLPATAVGAGMRSAFLAMEGITGPDECLDGKCSLLRGACAEEPEFDELTVPLEGNWYTMNAGNKPYCCCAGSHALIDCAAAIRNQGVDYRDIEKITIYLYDREVTTIGNIIHPVSVVESQFCARFAAAMRLVKGGNGFHDYIDENVNDPDIAAVIDKMEVVAVPFGTFSEENGAARMVVEMRDGTVYDETVPYALGTVRNPMGYDELADKFRDLVRDVLPPERAEEVLSTIMGLEEVDDIREFTKLLVAQ